MATTIGSIDNVLKEELAPGIRESLPDLDQVFKFIMSTSVGVERDGLGRTWQFIHTFETGLAGGYKIRSAAGPDVVSGINNVTMFGTPQGFPSQAEVTAAAYLQKIIVLKEGVGSISVPHQYLRADQLTAAIGSVVRAELRGTAKKVAHTHAVDFYTNDATNKVIGDVGTVGTTVTNDGTTAVTIDFAATSGGYTNEVSIRRFFPGMLVDIYNSAATVLLNVGYMVVVDQVDYINSTIIIKSVDGVSTIDLTDDDIIVFKDSKAQGFSGLESWIKNSGSDVFNINMATYPQFKSYIPSALSSALTEVLLNQHVARFNQSYGQTIMLDSWVTTPGVTVGYIAQLDGLHRFARNNERMDIQAGWGNFGYSYNGQDFKWLISSYCGTGLAYGIKLGENNIKRFVPPGIPGTASESGFDGSVEFIAPLGGSSGIFLHSRIPGSAAVGDNLEAPFVCLQEFCPDLMQSIKLSGITETIG